jgi:hypothetical protein
VIVKGEFPRLIHSSPMMRSVVRLDAAVDRIASLAGPAWKDQGRATLKARSNLFTCKDPPFLVATPPLISNNAGFSQNTRLRRIDMRAC